MKKVLLFVIIIMIVLSGCSNSASLDNRHDVIVSNKAPMSDSGLKNDEEIAVSVLEKLMNAESFGEIEYLFTKTAKTTENFYSNGEAFLVYIDGIYTSYEASPFATDSAKVDGMVTHIIHCAFRVQTTTGKYHIYFDYCGRNDADPENIGIQSLSTISAEQWGIDNPVTFRGNGTASPGIHLPN